MTWTSKDIPDLYKKVALITGANSGLGLQSAILLASKNARVIMACRNEEKANAAKRRILSSMPEADLTIVGLDLSSFDSIDESAKVILNETDQLDILMNNAGLGGVEFMKTKDGVEMNFGVNHLGHYLLTGKLLGLIKKSKKVRVVNTSSEMHRIGGHSYRDVNFNNRIYNRWVAYSKSKLANIHFSNGLNRRFKKHGVDAISVVAHPGFALTNLQTQGAKLEGNKMKERVMYWSTKLLSQSEEMGALPQTYAATAEDVRAGDYIGPSFLGWRGNPAKKEPSAWSKNKKLEEDLWSLSEELTNFKYNF